MRDCQFDVSPVNYSDSEQDFPHYKSMGIFFKRSRAANSAFHGRNWPKLELVLDFMVVLLTCMNQEDPIKNEGANKIICCCFFRRSRAANSKVSGGFLPKFELLVTCKNEEDPIKNKGSRVLTRFSAL